MSDSIITLYDIPSSFENKAWSPNIWKTRLALNYKGLPFKTTWVEYPDIASMCKDIGAAPTAKRKDGSDHYTLPVISDPKTGRVISDSNNIVEYLDEVYPELPTLFPPEYYRRKHELSSRCKMEEISPEGSKKDQLWEDARENLDAFAPLLDESGVDKAFITEDTISYADFLLAAWFMWGKIAFNAEEWEMLMGWNGGRWERLMKEYEKYNTGFEELRPSSLSDTA